MLLYHTQLPASQYEMPVIYFMCDFFNRYVAPSSTTSGEHLLLVSGSISGTLTVYCIQFDVNDVTSCLKRNAQTRKPPWEKQNYTTYSKEREKSNGRSYVV